jgi:hypothetical protein
MIRRAPRLLTAKGHGKKSKFNGAKSGRKKNKILIQFLIFLCYELSVCPLIFNSNKVYFASSLIAKPSPDAIGPYGSGQEPMSQINSPLQIGSVIQELN